MEDESRGRTDEIEAWETTDRTTDTDRYEEKVPGQGEPPDALIKGTATGEVPEREGFIDRQLDFEDDYGTTDVIESVAEGEVYFPPTDPVVRPARNLQGLEVLGGFSASSMDEPIEEEDHPWYIDLGDDEISTRVLTALREDAATTDLVIDVDTVSGIVYLRGKVPTLQDAELAMEVADRVDGVMDVEDELDIEE